MRQVSLLALFAAFSLSVSALAADMPAAPAAEANKPAPAAEPNKNGEDHHDMHTKGGEQHHGGVMKKAEHKKK